MPFSEKNKYFKVIFGRKITEPATEGERRGKNNSELIPEACLAGKRKTSENNNA